MYFAGVNELPESTRLRPKKDLEIDGRHGVVEINGLHQSKEMRQSHDTRGIYSVQEILCTVHV